MPQNPQKQAREIHAHFISLGVPEESIEWWWGLGSRSDKIIGKIHANLPTQEEMDAWREQPKGSLRSLQRIKFPTLCGWSVMDVFQAIKPFVFEHIKRYHTPRCDYDDCFQNGMLGVISAICNDAGMAVFSTYGFPWIRTCIRRASATSGTVKRPERQPSRTEVRRTLTVWLTGTWLQVERERLAKAKKKEYDSLKVRERKAIDKKADENLAVAQAVAPINTRKLILKRDMREYSVQRIGFKGVTELHVSETYQLSQLAVAVVAELLEYLNYRYGSNKDEEWICRSRSVLFRGVDLVQYPTIGSLVDRIADTPDFHGQPKPLSVQIDDGFSLGEALASDHGHLNRGPKDNGLVPHQTPDVQAEARERMATFRKLISAMRDAMGLSEAQAVVMKHLYGLDGETPKRSSEIADEYDKFVGKPPKKVLADGTEVYGGVSRQRVTQHIAAISRKAIDTAFRLMFLDRSNYQELMERGIGQADLTQTERRLLAFRYGVLGQSEHDESEIAANYEDVTGESLPRSLKGSGRCVVVGEQLREARRKMVCAGVANM